MNTARGRPNLRRNPMDIILRIEGDPAAWILEASGYRAVAQDLSQASRPVVLPVVAPLQGRLVLSPRCAGSIAVLGPPGGACGGSPATSSCPTALLYVPSVASRDAFPGYALARNTDLGALEQEIVAAMSQGSVLTVEVSDNSERGRSRAQRRGAAPRRALPGGVGQQARRRWCPALRSRAGHHRAFRTRSSWPRGRRQDERSQRWKLPPLQPSV